MIDALYHSEHDSDYMYIVLLPWNITITIPVPGSH